MIKAKHTLPRTRQCQLLSIHRSGTYYQPKPVSDADQALMKQIDRIHMAKPFLGSRRIVDALDDMGEQINRKRVARLMRLMGIRAIHRYGKPELFNSDQGSQFTSTSFTETLLDQDIRISMDGKGAWRDNVFVERLWRSVKYEEVYLKAYESMADARQSLKSYFEFYNQQRKHQTLKSKPDQVYYESIKLAKAA